MKRNYIKPSVVVIIINTSMMICGSKDIISEKGIDYGGVDEGGTKDPSSRQHAGVWDDEEDDE